MKGLRKKGQRKRDPIPPIETPGGPRPEDNELNKFLAQYNSTGNQGHELGLTRINGLLKA